MVVSGIARIVIDIVFLLIIPLINEDKPCIDSFNNHLGYYLIYCSYSIAYLIIGTWFLQFIPIIVILRLYRYKQQVKKSMLPSLKKSMLPSVKKSMLLSGQQDNNITI